MRIKNSYFFFLCFFFVAIVCGQEDLHRLRTIPSQNLGKQPTNTIESLKILELALNILELEYLPLYGNFTFFLPSDEALEEQERAYVTSLFKAENRNALFSFATYHMVAGKLSASSILKAMSQGKGSARFTTVQGQEILATLEGTDIVLMDCFGNKAIITSADKTLGSNVLHVIDKVILAD